MWPQMTQWVELELMSGREASQLMVCNGQWFQFRISNEILSVCVCVSAVVGWNEKSCKHTSGCVVWAKNTGQLKFEETQWERLKYLQSDHTGTIARTLECVFFFLNLLPPGVCPRLSAPRRTPSPPPHPRVCWECTCWKCRSWACAFAV